VFKKVIGQEEVGDSDSPISPSVPEQQHRSAPASAPAATYGGSSVSSSPVTSTTATRNILSSDVEIKGTVKFSNELVVDGKIEGEITSSGNLTVGENARLKAEIRTGTVVVYGKVHGNITAASHVELKASAEVLGDIKAATLSIEAGAIFVGKSTVGAPTQSVAPAQAPAVAAPAPAAATPAASVQAHGSVKQASLLDESTASKPQAARQGV